MKNATLSLLSILLMVTASCFPILSMEPIKKAKIEEQPEAISNNHNVNCNNHQPNNTLIPFSADEDRNKILNCLYNRDPKKMKLRKDKADNLSDKEKQQTFFSKVMPLMLTPQGMHYLTNYMPDEIQTMIASEIPLNHLTKPLIPNEVLEYEKYLAGSAYSSKGTYIAHWDADTTKLYIETISKTNEREFVNYIEDPFSENDSSPQSYAFSPDEKLFALGSNQGSIAWFELEDIRLSKLSLIGHTTHFIDTDFYSIEDLCFSLDNTLLAASDSEGKCTIWKINYEETQDNKYIKLFEYENAYAIDFNPCKKLFAVYSAIDKSAKGIIQLFDYSAKLKGQLEVNGHNTSRMHFSPNGKYLIFGSSSKIDDDTQFYACAWDQETGETTSIKVAETLSAICFSPDSKYAIIGDEKGNVYIWNLVNNKNNQFIKGNDTRIHNSSYNNKSGVLDIQSDKNHQWNLKNVLGLHSIEVLRKAMTLRQLYFLMLVDKAIENGTQVDLEEKCWINDKKQEQKLKIIYDSFDDNIKHILKPHVFENIDVSDISIFLNDEELA